RTDGKKNFFKPCTVDRMEEITLVLRGIEPLQKQRYSVADFRAAVMPGREKIASELHRFFEEGVELDLAIAEDVRVRRVARFVLGEEPLKHPIPVFFDELDRVVGDVETTASLHDVFVVLRGGANAIRVLFFPILHEET